jgi:hypothetical protein
MKTFKITTGIYNTSDFKIIASYNSFKWLEKKCAKIFFDEWLYCQKNNANFKDFIYNGASYNVGGKRYTIHFNY